MELRSKMFDGEASLFIYLQIISYPIFFRFAMNEVMTVQEANFASLSSPPANLFSLMHGFSFLLLHVERIFGAKRDEKTH